MCKLLRDLLTAIPIEMRHTVTYFQGQKHAALSHAHAKAINGNGKHILGLIDETTFPLFGGESASKTINRILTSPKTIKFLNTYALPASAV